MTWLRDLDDDLLNLDHVQSIEVLEQEQEPGEESSETHAVIARFPGEINNARYIFVGSEADCRVHRDKIMLKLPMVRF